MLPGVKIETYYNRRDLLNVTTETVRENLLLGMGLVTAVLLMFLSNVRSALIVAINVPLALLFAFVVLFVRGKSANLLSIGAVDFGIIVDSSVIMVENIYRHLAAGENADLPLKTRIIRAAGEIDRALLFSTLIMMCAFIPLFTMQGPEGALFGPMAQTYAFALAGALVLAVMLAPVLCLLLFKNLKPVPDNLLVRLIKYSYLRQLDRCLRHRWLTVLFFGALIAGTACLVPSLGREFMPELEEGNLWVQAQFPLNSSLEEVCALAAKAHEIFKQCPEGECVLSQVGRPDDGTDPAGFYNAEFFLPLKPRSQWPILPGMSRPRTKEELTAAVTKELESSIIAAEWNFSQNIRNMVIESLSGVRGENCVKIIGPDLAGLEQLANRVVKVLKGIKGLDEVGVYRVMGQSNLTLPVDRQKCARWNLKVGDVQAVVDTAVGGKPFSQMIEGERSFDITLRYAKERRANLDAILKIPVEVGGNTVASSQSPGQSATPVSGANIGPSPTGTAADLPSLTGSGMNATFNDLGRTPHRRLGDLVIPHTADGRPDPHGSFMQQGASDIYRDQGERLIAVKFDIHGRDLAGAVEEARQKTKHLFQAPYRGVWTGEFEEMQDAETRLLKIVPMSLGLIFILLYLALRSWLDAVVVISNVFALAIGGVWALYLTGTNFNISAAVGFISLFGVAIMDGLLMISYFNTLRAQGEPLDRAIIEGAGKRVRPVMMTALTALFGLLPAALSTQIGSQTQRPLAIVVVGGMMTTILLTRYLMPVLYSFYGHREPPAEAAAGVVH